MLLLLFHPKRDPFESSNLAATLTRSTGDSFGSPLPTGLSVPIAEGADDLRETSSGEGCGSSG